MRTHLPFAALALGAAWVGAGCIVNNNTTPPPQCSDGLDNDGDGKVDFPNDPGCTSADDNSEQDNVATQGTVTVSWDLQDWSDVNKQAITAVCPAGGDTAIVYNLPAGQTDPANAIKDLFNCADGGGTTNPIAAGSYTTWVEITDHSGAVLYAQSNSQATTVTGGGNTSESYQFQVNRGYVAGQWTLQGATSGSTLSCQQAGAGGVEFDDMVGNGTPISDQFDCPPMTGTTYPLPIADYTLTMQAVDSSPTPIGIGPGTVAGDANVQFGNQLVNKGSFVLQVDNL